MSTYASILDRSPHAHKVCCLILLSCKCFCILETSPLFCFYILETSPLSGMWLANIFYHTVGYLHTFLIMFFEVQLKKHAQFMFSFVTCAFSVTPMKLLPIPRS